MLFVVLGALGGGTSKIQNFKEFGKKKKIKKKKPERTLFSRIAFRVILEQVCHFKLFLFFFALGGRGEGETG